MQNTNPEDEKVQPIFTPVVNSGSGSQPPVQNAVNAGQPGNQQSFFYTQEQDDDFDLQLPPIDEQDDQANQSSPFVLPFQNSAAMPTIATMNTQGAQVSMGIPSPSAPSPGKTHRVSLSLIKILLIVSVVLITIIGAGFFVFAQPTSSPSATQVNGTQTNGAIRISPAPTPKQTQAPATKTKTSPTGSSSKTTNNPPPNQNQGQGTQAASSLSSSSIPSTQLLNQIGWTQAGLSFGDAIEVIRTGNTFTDREMSYDYRNIGTPTAHSGTLTGSTFLLTSGGKIRFVQNDVRMINNVLYNKILNGKIIQQVVNAQPSLVQFQTIPLQGQPYQFAWVNVAFELFQSKIDPTSGERTESIKLNTTTGQPAIHHLVVVLVWVSPQNQGVNAPMGGTGWLVNTYALDMSTLPAIATSPSL
jgi:hypothetical protein